MLFEVIKNSGMEIGTFAMIAYNGELKQGKCGLYGDCRDAAR